MITLSAKAQAVLMSSSMTRFYRVESWRAGELLTDDVPVTAASETVDRSLRVPERVSFTVPRRVRGASWAPVGEDHPLAANGQRLRVQLGIGIGAGQVEWFSRGWFLVQSAIVQGDSVSVEAVGLLTLIDEARLISPYQPTGTLKSTLQGLIEPALTVEFEAGLADRSVPAGINYDEDRLGAVTELLDAAPWTGYVHPDGYMSISAADPTPVSVLSLTNGRGGTIIEANGSSTREDSYNAVVSRGTATNGTLVQGTAYDTTGPKRYKGPFNPLPVPFYFYSPLLTTTAQCTVSSRTILLRKKREQAMQLDAEIVPHPALQAGDVVTVTTDTHTDLACSIEGLTLPYNADGGSQRLTLRELVTL